MKDITLTLTRTEDKVFTNGETDTPYTFEVRDADGVQLGAEKSTASSVTLRNVDVSPGTYVAAISKLGVEIISSFTIDETGVTFQVPAEMSVTVADVATAKR